MKTITCCTRDCLDACSILAEVGENGSVRLEGNPDHPVTAGVMCAKTRRFGRVLRSPNRITEPLLRRGDGWQPIGWAEALDLCAGRIQNLRDEPSAMLHIFSVGSKGLTARISQWFFGMLGATRVEGSLCDGAGATACELDFGVRDTNDVTDLPNARRIVNWGRDLSRSSIHSAMYVQEARRRGAEVLTISPGGDGNEPFSDRQIRVRPGTDRFLAAAVIRLLIELDQISPHITTHTYNWSAFRDLIMEHPLEELSATCGVSISDIEDIAAFYTGADPVATIIAWGLQRHWFGGENVRFINAVALLSGSIGKSGGGSYFSISTWRNFNWSWATAPGEDERRTFYKPIIAQNILEATDPPIRMIWANGNNMVNQAPDARTTARAFGGVEFKVVVDAFMTDTAARADLVLPCALMLEREDIVGSPFHNYANYAGVAVPPPEGARTDHWILSEVGKRLDPPVIVPAVEEILRTALDSPHLDVSLEELRERGYARGNWPQVAFEGLRFAHPDGLYRFPETLHYEPPLPGGYPLHLLSLLRRDELHSQILPEDHPALSTVWVSPDCAHLADVDLDRDVYLASPLERVKVKIEMLPDLHPEACICRRGTWMKLGGGINQLVTARLTDIGECSPAYSQGVRLEN